MAAPKLVCRVRLAAYHTAALSARCSALTALDTDGKNLVDLRELDLHNLAKMYSLHQICVSEKHSDLSIDLRTHLIAPPAPQSRAKLPRPPAPYCRTTVV